MRIEISNNGKYALVAVPEFGNPTPLYMPNVLNFVFHDLKCYSLQGFLVELSNGESEIYYFNSNDFMYHTKNSLREFTEHIQRSYVLVGLVFDKYDDAKLVKYEFEKMLTFQLLKESYK